MVAFTAGGYWNSYGHKKKGKRLVITLSKEEAEEIESEAYFKEESDVPIEYRGEQFLVYSSENEEGFVVAYYDYSTNCWFSAETLEPVMATEFWPLPPIGTGVQGEECEQEETKETEKDRIIKEFEHLYD